MTFTVGCLALHARRVLSSRHALTCHVTAAREHAQKDGRGWWRAMLCGGEWKALYGACKVKGC
jgi:hypothetical protein